MMADKEPTPEAYCVKCKAMRPLEQAERVVMKNGRPALRGACGVCGTKLNKILPGSAK